MTLVVFCVSELTGGSKRQVNSKSRLVVDSWRTVHGEAGVDMSVEAMWCHHCVCSLEVRGHLPPPHQHVLTASIHFN